VLFLTLHLSGLLLCRALSHCQLAAGGGWLAGRRWWRCRLRTVCTGIGCRGIADLAVIDHAIVIHPALQPAIREGGQTDTENDQHREGGTIQHGPVLCGGFLVA